MPPPLVKPRLLCAESVFAARGSPPHTQQDLAGTAPAAGSPCSQRHRSITPAERLLPRTHHAVRGRHPTHTLTTSTPSAPTSPTLTALEQLTSFQSDPTPTRPTLSKFASQPLSFFFFFKHQIQKMYTFSTSLIYQQHQITINNIVSTVNQQCKKLRRHNSKFISTIQIMNTLKIAEHVAT